MWTYRGKEEEDGQTYDGKMHARETWQKWVGSERGQHDKPGRMEEEANKLYRRPQMTAQAREEEEERS